MRALPLLNPENVTEEELKTFKTRTAVRALVFDTDNNMAIHHATREGYCKLPGGGVEVGESYEEALARECKEEIGCAIEIMHEVASQTEYRKKLLINQTSLCYIARVVGEKGTPAFEPEEIEHGVEVLWLPMAEARRRIAESVRNVYEASYMVARDIALIDAADAIMHTP
jgi:8-oxo-dGTP diphosphatase